MNTFTTYTGSTFAHTLPHNTTHALALAHLRCCVLLWFVDLNAENKYSS
jgi:hypothetical protein